MSDLTGAQNNSYRLSLSRVFMKSFWKDTVRLDLRSLGLVRVLVGIVLFFDLIARAIVFEPMQTELGIAPFKLFESGGINFLSTEHFSLHLLNPSYFFQLTMLAVAFFCAIGLVLGWKARFMIIASWILHVSVMTRTPFYGSGEGVALNVILFWMMYMPIGERFSIDQRTGKVSPWTPIALTGSTCYLIHVILIYLCASYAKGSRWRDGHALLDIMNVDLVASSFGNSLTQWPFLLRLMSSGAFYVEAIGPFLLLVPFFRSTLRGICTAMFLGLHAGIAATCDIGLFPYVSMVMWVAFLPGEFWDRIETLCGKKFGGGTNDEMHSKDIEQENAKTWHAIVVQSLAILVAATTLSSAVVYAAPGIRKLRNLTAVEAVVSANLSFTKLTQSWGVFVFGKNPRDGWFVVEATLSDGTKIDLLRDASPIDWSKPPLSGPRRTSVVWRTYLDGQVRSGGNNLSRYAAWLNDNFQRRRPDSAPVQNVKVVFMDEPAPGYGQDETVTPITLWSGHPSTP